MSRLENTLDILLSESIEVDSISIANRLVDLLELNKQKVRDLQHQLQSANNKISGDLAMAIRIRNPAFNIGVSRSGCKVGYLSKSLTFTPNPKRKIWIVKGSDPSFVRRFNNNYRSAILMNKDLTMLIDSIVDHFRAHFRSIDESTSEVGKIIIEDKISNINGLKLWSNNNHAHFELNDV